MLIGGKYPSALLFLDGSVNSDELAEHAVKPLCGMAFKNITLSELKEAILSNTFSLNVSACLSCDEAIKKIAYGNAVLAVCGLDVAFVFEAMPKNVRSVSEPTSENVTKGSKDCFCERAKTNISLIRARLTNPLLKTQKCTIGRQSATDIYFMSVDTVVNPDCLNIARKRIESLDIDCVGSLGVIEEALRENDCLFPQTLFTERPDRVCAFLNEGCIAIIVNGFPFVLIAPVSIVHHLSTADDYSRHHVAASAIRIMRYILLINALILPGFYIAVATFHQEMLPGELASSIIRSRMSVPFNDFVETMVLLLAFEVLAEAGLRMPRNIGQTVSIVGGLIVGDAAVNAKIISPIVVIVVAMSMVATYTIPDQDFSNAVRLCRLLLSVACAIFGLSGLTFGVICIIINLCSSRSLGVPYMAPLLNTSPPTKDTVLRKKFSDNLLRPQFLGGKNAVRRRNG